MLDAFSFLAVDADLFWLWWPDFFGRFRGCGDLRQLGKSIIGRDDGFAFFEVCLAGKRGCPCWLAVHGFTRILGLENLVDMVILINNGFVAVLGLHE